MEYANPWFRVVRDGADHWIQEPGSHQGAAILPVIGDCILLLEQQRAAQGGAITLEIPRGYAEPGETEKACACRELAEETGIVVREMDLRPLGRVRPNTSVLASCVALFWVTVPKGTIPEPGDRGCEKYHLVPVREMARWLAAGRLEDGFTLSAWAFYVGLGIHK
ncbi:hypothetical protein CKO33_12765 [Ectothiorhodospira mobilis]|nr:hypothetical protein [Ectothiorhodospira mobilis]